jgi:hypothetical protein
MAMGWPDELWENRTTFISSIVLDFSIVVLIKYLAASEPTTTLIEVPILRLFI